MSVICSAAPVVAFQSIAQETLLLKSATEVAMPISGAIMHEEYVKIVGRMAYVWGWPMANSLNRRAAITQAPEPGRCGGVVPVAPRGRIGNNVGFRCARGL